MQPSVQEPPTTAPPPARERTSWWRRHYWVRRIALAAAILLVLVAAGGILAWNVTPGVNDAQARTAAVVRAHGGISDGGRPPARVTAALVATEDSRFYSHHGLDPQSLARGMLTLVTDGQLQGATLDAQLAKLLYSDGHSGFRELAQEAVLAFKLDDRYTKPQILAMYLDAAYFGHGAWGVERAARTFFGRSAQELSWGQATMLAGLVNAPTAYDPTVHLHLARKRQHHVLDRLVATHAMTRAEADAVFAEPLNPAIPFSG